MKKLLFVFATALLFFQLSNAAITVKMYKVGEQAGQAIGTVTFEPSKFGLLIIPDLRGLPPGLHGFHIHENAQCGKDGMAAGGHLDPGKTGKHLGPYNVKGHLGDLPALYVDSNGRATLPILAPRIRYNNIINGHTLMIHAGGDNYSDEPKMGGGGARIACGAIP